MGIKAVNGFMRVAAREALAGVKKDHGGPFGAVIVRDGKVIAKAHNTVLKTFDPTAHAEINAIRAASKKLKAFDLSGTELFTTCEPCPMCLSAIIWARIGRVYFSATKLDAEAAGFRDDLIYRVFEGKSSGIVDLVNVSSKDVALAFKAWQNKPDRTVY